MIILAMSNVPSIRSFKQNIGIPRDFTERGCNLNMKELLGII